MVITSPKLAFNFLKLKFTDFQTEELWIVALDSNSRVISTALLFKGTVNYCLFHPRDIFRFAVLHNSVSYLIAHNHPSGDPNPSEDDINLTKELVLLSKMMKIPLEDHLVITPNSYYSFAQSKDWKKWHSLKNNKTIVAGKARSLQTF